jgi:hypothetical protein
MDYAIWLVHTVAAQTGGKAVWHSTSCSDRRIFIEDLEDKSFEAAFHEEVSGRGSSGYLVACVCTSLGPRA